MEKKLEPMKLSDQLTWNRKELAEVTWVEDYKDEIREW